jgi:hypothetical protein
MLNGGDIIHFIKKYELSLVFIIKTNNSSRRKSPTTHPYFFYLLRIYIRPGSVKCKRPPFLKGVYFTGGKQLCLIQRDIILDLIVIHLFKR